MEQSELLLFLCRNLARVGVRYFITGSHATIAFGEPRFTNDIDVVVELDEQSCTEFCAGFPAPEFYLNLQTALEECRRRGMFNIIHPASGLKIDVIVAKQDANEQLRFERAMKLPIADDCDALFSSPEDIILQKMKWHRMGGGERHLRDIAGILKVRGDALDREYVSRSAQTLDLTDLWEQVQGTIQ